MLISATELIKQSWKDYVDRWHDWTIMSLLVFLPTFILMVAGSFGIYLSLNVPSMVEFTNIIILILSIAALFFGFWTSLAIIHAAGSYIKEGRVEYWKDHYAETTQHLWTGIYISIILSLIVFFGVILLVIPGIIFLVWYYFSMYEIVIGNKKGWNVMRGSHELVRGRWWASAWRIVAPLVIFGTLVIAAQYILLAIVESFPLAIESTALLENVVNAILSALAAPLTTLVAARLYYSLKENPVSQKIETAVPKP